MSESSDSKKSRRLSVVVRAIVAAGALVWVFRGQNWRLLGEHLANLNLGYLGLSVGVYILAQVLVSVRWWLLLRAQSIHIPVSAAVGLYFLGLFYGNVMPSSVGGDVLRAWYVTKHTPKRLEAVLSVFVDRVVGFAGTAVIALCTYLLFFRGGTWQGPPGVRDRGTGSGWQYTGEIVGVFVVLVVSPAALLVHKRGRRLLGRAWFYVREHGVRAMGRVRDAVVIYCSKPLTMVLAFGLTIVVQTSVITAFWLLGRNLGIAAEAKYYFVFFPLTWGLAALPVSIAGIGVLEGGVRELFTRLAGVSAEKAVALALCQRFAWVIGSLPGVLVHLAGTHLPKDFFVDYDKTGN